MHASDHRVPATPAHDARGSGAGPVARLRPRWALLLGLLCAAVLPVAAADAPVDHLELAAVLTRDGAHDRARAALAQVDPDAPGVDRVRYETVRGLLAMGQQDLARAADAFGAAITAATARARAGAGAGAGGVDPLLQLHHAQALFGLDRFAEALAALEAAGDAVDGLSGAWMMRAHAHWQLQQHQAAIDTLASGAARFPSNAEFRRRQVVYLLELGLFQAAARLGESLLSAEHATAADVVAIGTALRQAGSVDTALRVLEQGRLRFPDDGLVARALAQAWLAAGKPLAAAELLARQAEREPVLLPDAAELFRRAGQHARALALNARVSDPARKLQQRIGLLVELGRYADVVAMEEPLYRAGLLADEDVRYALAYAHFHGADYAAAERHLAALTRPELFRRATELRRLMQDCDARRWDCG